MRLRRALASRLPDGLLLDALSVAREIQESDDRTEALGVLAPHPLAGEYNNGRSFADILGTMAPQLSTDWVHRGLTIPREIKVKEFRAQALGALARQLSTEEQKRGLSEVLIAACETEVFQRSRIPLDLAPDLPAELLSDARRASRRSKQAPALYEPLESLCRTSRMNLLGRASN